jgi:hypothetical protein
MPKSIIRDEIAISRNRRINPLADLCDLTNLRRKTGASQAANETGHLPLEKMKSMIPIVSKR